ncbi:TPA: DUF1471 domain-containing protein [Enterobacter kobei]|nr:DUF1471 domain-containing protein [Enterobacter kobei]
MLGLFFFTTAQASALPVLAERHDIDGKEHVGAVSVSGVRGSSDDAIRQLQKKAQEAGGNKLRITGFGTLGDSSLWMGTAEVYR